MRLFFPCFLLVSIARAQIFTVSDYVLRLDDEGKSYSVFPIFHSPSRPKVAAALNQALQMHCFSKIQTAKNPDAIKNLDEEDYTKWSYTVDFSNEKMVYVTTYKWVPAGGMHTPDYTLPEYYYFDATTGDPFFCMDFFSSKGFADAKAQFKNKVGRDAGQRYEAMKKKYPAARLNRYLPDITACIGEIHGEIDKLSEPTSFDIAARSASFNVGWCSDAFREEDENTAVPELGNGFGITFGNADLSPLMSEYWSYYILRTGQAPVADPIVHLWKGTIGEKIPVTMLINFHPGVNRFYGREAYDHFGGVIYLSCVKTGNTYLLNELDENDAVVGYFEVTPTDAGQLTGTWTKADKSRSMPFKATRAGR